MRTSSIHIVRRYGLVGGMENYVFHLAKSLASKGHGVTILCEVDESVQNEPDGDVDSTIDVVVLGNRYRKPRWLAQWGFSQRVTAYLQEHEDLYRDVVIHSHERTGVHHVTTFHGPPFFMRRRRWSDVLSPRIHMWTYLEKQELQGNQVKAILPNSALIADQLTSLYPTVAHKVLAPAYPGVAPSYSLIRRDISGVTKSHIGTTIGFLGKEWQRKGLDIACKIVRQVRERMPQVHFVVAGCDPAEVTPLFFDWPKGSYTILGWTSQPEDFLAQVDMLLHPARSEPFGMVVAEANAAGLPVVVSDLCGVAPLITDKQGSVCRLNTNEMDLRLWVEACCHWLTMTSTRPNDDPITAPLNLSWDSLAEQHIALYQQLLQES